MMKSLSALGMIAAAALFCAAPLSLHWSPAKSLSLSVDAADARVGRPLTPMSVAGVNRRVHRRAYYGTQQLALMATPAGVHIGMQVLAAVGIEPLE
jgi:hypothetical protein